MHLADLKCTSRIRAQVRRADGGRSERIKVGTIRQDAACSEDCNLASWLKRWISCFSKEEKITVLCNIAKFQELFCDF